MGRKRITAYEDAGKKMKLVIDYCARYAVVPRKSDDPNLPSPWEGVPANEVQQGILEKFGVNVSNGTPTYTWQRLGADNDLEGALKFLQDRREEILENGQK
ncbi:hypothetical protein [Haloferax marisrubri]|uniref:hypothetical protein n=1 Tax=Haloferax marisrubri TaxID=1544719 RepID=UPI0011AF1BD4|nr:hypothetical protein [Haloferax marisrubri]